MHLPLHYLIDHARTHSPYHADRLAHLPRYGWSLQDLPLGNPADGVPQETRPGHWPMLTAAPVDARLVCMPGRASFFATDEWRLQARILAHALARLWTPGQHIGSLFRDADTLPARLFASALDYLPVPVLYANDQDDALPAGFRPDCLAGDETGLASHATGPHADTGRPRTLLHLGRGLPGAQRIRLQYGLPGARIVHAALLHPACGLVAGQAGTPGSLQGFSHIITEIIDREGQPVTAADQAGQLVVTSLLQRLAPVIRLPTGFMASWDAETPGIRRTFRLQDAPADSSAAGRSESETAETQDQ